MLSAIEDKSHHQRNLQNKIEIYSSQTQEFNTGVKWAAVQEGGSRIRVSSILQLHSESQHGVFASYPLQPAHKPFGDLLTLIGVFSLASLLSCLYQHLSGSSFHIVTHSIFW